MRHATLKSSALLTGLIIVSLITIDQMEPIRQDKKPKKGTPEWWHQQELGEKIARRAAGYAKPDQPDKFAQLHRLLRTADGDFEPRYAASYRIDEMKKAGILDRYGRSAVRSGFRKANALLPWVERGPANFSGRTRGLIVDPDDPTDSTWFAGSVGGGIWKTTDAGRTWENKTPDLPNLATSVLAYAVSNPDIMYAGTGEGFFNADAIQGDGIWKSTDHGDTWFQLASTVAVNQSDRAFENVNRIVVSPTNPDIVIAATNEGIYKSVNGGTSWTQVYDAGSSRVQQIVQSQVSFDTLYATVNGSGVFKSTNGGDNWYKSSNGIAAGSRFEMATAPSNNARLFVAAENGSNSDLYMSDNHGITWAIVAEQGGAGPNWLGAQGWYDNTIAVHPYNDSTVFVGGINLWKIDVKSGGGTTAQYSADTTGSSSFLGFVNFGLSFLGGGVGTAREFFSDANGNPIISPVGLTQADTQITVEIRFGAGIKQKAHRFGFSANFAYIYKGYVEVPFQVWDVTNNRQLMASFRDQDSNLVWDLDLWTQSFVPREYVFVNVVPYDTVADPNIATTAGQAYKALFAVGPALADGGTWTPDALPTSKLTWSYSVVTTRPRITTQITNWFPGQSKPGGGTYPWVHADQHNIVMIPKTSPNDFWVIAANDGGYALSKDGGVTWIFDESTSDGYRTTQFYGVDKKPGSSTYIGGTQDNGTWRSPLAAQDTSVWFEQLGGDGFDAVWKYNDSTQLLGSIYNNAIYKSTNGGTTWFQSNTGLGDVGGNGPFITQIGRSKLDPELVFAVGAQGVWRSENFGDSWALSPISSSNWGFNGLISQIEISKADPQIVWAGTSMSSTGKVNVSTDGGLTFTPTVNFPTVTLGTLSGLASHPTDPDVAYALFSIADKPKILRTTDLGQTWEDISGFGTNSNSSNGFPDVAVYSLLVMPHNTDEIWAGTDIGLFISTDGGANWAYANNGLPAVAIWEMNIVDKEVVVATHGRGIWSVEIPAIPDLSSVILAPSIKSAGQNPASGALVVSAKLRSSYDSTVVKLNGASALTTTTASVKDTNLSVPTSLTGSVSIQLISWKNGTSYKSASQTKTLVPAMAATASYKNTFNSATTDFIGNGFSITTPSGFTNGAIHTPHPYAANQTYIYQLGVPVIVAASPSILKFDEIALIEAGEPGSVFGDEDFYDYVIVEGTSDGITWVPLLDGYDLRANAAWSTGQTGTPSLFRPRQIDLAETFTAGTAIYIRFRLFSDPGAEEWGWAIDNLFVNGDLTAPTVSLGLLASPVVNVVQFVVGANENISTLELRVNSLPVTLRQEGRLHFANYTIPGSGAMTAFVTMSDTNGNASNLTRNYTVSPVSKGLVLDGYRIEGEGDGYLIAGVSPAANIPSHWTAVASAIDLTQTGSTKAPTVNLTYGDLSSLQTGIQDYDERRIGLYGYVNGEWVYLGGEGTGGQVAAAATVTQVAAFYNPDHEVAPKEFALLPNFPNPFNPTTTIRYEVPVAGKVVIKVYNMLGQEVRSLVNDIKQPGRYSINWDGKNSLGQQVSSGVYIYRLNAGKIARSRKMMLIK